MDPFSCSRRCGDRRCAIDHATKCDYRRIALEHSAAAGDCENQDEGSANVAAVGVGSGRRERSGHTIQSYGRWCLFLCAAVSFILFCHVAFAEKLYARFMPLAPTHGIEACSVAVGLHPFCPVMSTKEYPPRLRFPNYLDTPRHGCRDPLCGVLFPGQCSLNMSGCSDTLDNQGMHKGSVHEQHKHKPRHVHAVGSHPVFVAYSGEVVDHFPASCEQILKTDQVASKDIALKCEAWCGKALGPNINLFGSLSCTVRSSLSFSHERHIAFSADAQTVCGKARLAAWMRKIPQTWVPVLPYVVGLAYGVPGILRAWRPGAYLVVPETSGNRPSDSFSDNSPYRGPLYWPLRQVVASGDAGISQVLLWSKLLFVSTEPMLDAASLTSYMVQGQPIYAALTLGSILASADVFQLRGHMLLRHALNAGHETEDILEHHQLEGLIEGPIGAIIALWSFMNADPMAMSPTTTMILVLTILQSAFLTVPDAAVSSRVLRAMFEGTSAADFYGLIAVRGSVGFGIKFVPTFALFIAGPSNAFLHGNAFCVGVMNSLFLLVVAGNLVRLKVGQHVVGSQKIGQLVTYASSVVIVSAGSMLFLFSMLSICVHLQGAQGAWLVWSNALTAASKLSVAGVFQTCMLVINGIALLGMPYMLRTYINDLRREDEQRKDDHIKMYNEHPLSPGRYIFDTNSMTLHATHDLDGYWDSGKPIFRCGDIVIAEEIAVTSDKARVRARFRSFFINGDTGTRHACIGIGGKWVSLMNLESNLMLWKKVDYSELGE